MGYILLTWYTGFSSLPCCYSSPCHSVGKDNNSLAMDMAHPCILGPVEECSGFPGSTHRWTGHMTARNTPHWLAHTLHSCSRLHISLYYKDL